MLKEIPLEMTNQIVITVYITNKNYGKYLDKSIKSVTNQSFKNYEIIIIDDASTDNSKKIIHKYEKHKKCRVIYNKKSLGLIKCSNMAIKAARGDYVIRLDADDFLNRNALLVMYNEIKNDKKIALVYPDYYLTDEKGKIISEEKQINSNFQKNKNQPPLGACCLIRKDVMFSINFYDEKFNKQDGYDLWYKIYRKFRVKNINLPLFFYRRHSNNLTKSKTQLYKTRTKILSKFSNLKNNKKNMEIVCLIPVRGKSIFKGCLSSEIIKNKPLIFHTFDNVLQCKYINKIIFVSSDENLHKILKKKYKSQIKYYKRERKLSYENVDFKLGINKAIQKFYPKKKPDIAVIATIESPFRDSIYIEQAIDNMILHNYELVIGVKPDIENNYYKFSRNGLSLISNNNKSSLKFEKDVILRECGGINVYDYKILDKKKFNQKLKIGHVVLDKKSSINILSLDDMKIAERL